MLRKRKAQAAMEFLMTYGWAILAAIIVIGAIGYLYLSNIGRSNVGAINAPFYMQAFTIQSGVGAASTVTLELINKGSETVDLSSVTISGCGAAGFNVAANCSGGAATSVVSGGTVYVCGTTCGVANSGDNFKGNIIVNWQRPGSAIDQQASGSVAGDAK